LSARPHAVSDEAVIFCFRNFVYYTLNDNAAGGEEASIPYFELLAWKKMKPPLIAYLQFVGKKLIFLEKSLLNGDR
jgi:hypothetical protein